MTPPPAAPDPRPSPPPRRGKWWRNLFFILALLAVAGAAGGAWWAWLFIQNQLAPLVSESLSKELNRPVRIGKLEQFQFDRLRFGPSQLPATATDMDRATIEAISVKFNPWQLLWQRQLALDVTLIKPQAYVEQDLDGLWIDTKIQASEEKGAIEIQLAQLRVEDGQVEFSPKPKPKQKRQSVRLKKLSGFVKLLENNRQFSYYLTTESATQGKFRLRGESRLVDKDQVLSKINVEGENFLLREIDQLIHLPVDIQSGQANGKFDITLNPDLSFQLLGRAQVKQVNLMAPATPKPFTGINGEIALAGQTVTLNNVRAKYGQIPFVANGDIDPKQGFNLTGRVANLSIPSFFKTFGLQSPVPIIGAAAADLSMRGRINAPVLAGQVRNTQAVIVDKLAIGEASGQFSLNTGNGQLQLQNLVAIPQVGGRVTGGGVVTMVNQPRVALKLNAQSMPANAIAQVYAQQAPPFRIGRMNAQVRVDGTADNLVTRAEWQAPESVYAATGNLVIRRNGQAIDLQRLSAQAYGGSVSATGQLRDRQWNANVRITNANLAQLNPQLTGRASGIAQLRGNLDQPSLEQTSGTINLTAQTYGGTVRAAGQLANQRWQARVNLAGLQLSPINPELRGSASGQLQLQGGLRNLDQLPQALAQTRATGQLRLSQGIALVEAPIDARFNWDGQNINLLSAIGRNLQASGRLLTQLQDTPSITGLDLQVNARQLSLAALPLALPETLSVNGRSDFNGRIKGTLTAPQIQGKLTLNQLNVAGLGFESLRGQVNVEPGKGIELETQGNNDRLAFRLNSQNQPIGLNVQRGKLKIMGQARGNLFDLALVAVPLAEINKLNPNLPQVKGLLSGNLLLDLARNELPQANIVVDQVATGAFPLAFRSGKVQANLRYVNNVARGKITLSEPRLGTLESNDVSTNFVYANNVLRVPELVLQKGDSRFKVAGSVDLRSTPKVAGSLAIEKGRIEDVLGALQIFELRDLARGFAFPAYGRANSLRNPATRRNLQMGAANRSNVSLKTQLERLAELNMELRQIAQQRRALLRPTADGKGTETMLPELADIRGRFNSNMRFQFGPNGLTVDEFKLQARGVEWRPYPGYSQFKRIGSRIAVIHNDSRVLILEALSVDASYTDGQLNLARANAQIGQGQVTLQLNYGGESTSGQLTLTKLPITKIQRFYPLPVNLVGEITGRATIGGSRENPNVNGRIRITEAAINGRPVKQAGGFFGYNQGRMNLDTRIYLDNPEPVTIEKSEPLSITAEFPLPLPFIENYPTDFSIAADINVKNEGLALINLFDSQVKWLKGKGDVALQVRGDLTDIKAAGSASLNDASFSVQGLPEPITNVNGSIRFDRDLVRVEKLAGKFSQGNVAAQGTIPLFGQDADITPIPKNLPLQDCLARTQTPPGADGSGRSTANPALNVVLNRISLTYKGLYQGGVRGCVNVAGNLFQPRVTGEIDLFNGQVILADEVPQPTAPSVSDNSRVSASQAAAAVASSGLEFEDLKLKLGRNLQIVKPPIVNFVATGTLTVNGDLNSPQPEGDIRLRSGVVNLFTTQFVLARGYPHRASFLAGGGLDPFLDIRLIASVPEVTRNPLRTQAQETSSEITDSTLFATGVGSLQTVRIEAKVSGASSVLFDNLELSSSPSRSRNEIIGLIGGGFVDTLGRGDSTLGIANLAGSALLTNIQGFIGNALGLSEFRLFPTISTDEDRRSSTLGLAAEAGVDITPALSGSVLKILTSDKPAQFGLRYRINDNFLFRGSSDFFGDSQAVLEYNARF